MRPELAAVDGTILSLTNPRSEVTKGTDSLANLLEAWHGRGSALSGARHLPRGIKGGRRTGP